MFKSFDWRSKSSSQIYALGGVPAAEDGGWSKGETGHRTVRTIALESRMHERYFTRLLKSENRSIGYALMTV
jgi:hypothetical protein